MSEPKVVIDGPRKGHTQKICTKCGHIHHMPPDSGSQFQQQQSRP